MLTTHTTAQTMSTETYDLTRPHDQTAAYHALSAERDRLEGIYDEFESEPALRRAWAFHDVALDYLDAHDRAGEAVRILTNALDADYQSEERIDTAREATREASYTLERARDAAIRAGFDLRGTVTAEHMTTEIVRLTAVSDRVWAGHDRVLGRATSGDSASVALSAVRVTAPARLGGAVGVDGDRA